LHSIERILSEVNNLKRIGEQYSQQDRGTLSIAATHTQARYVLPKPVAQLRTTYPLVNVSMHQGAPGQVAQMVLDEVAELGMATESLADYPDLVTLPCYAWEHVLVLPVGHALADQPLSLTALAQQPLVTYHPSFTGRTRIDNAFAKAHLQPRVALEAIDSDVIKTYVRLGMGVGIVAEMAMNEKNEDDLVCRPLGHLLGHNVARVAFKRGAYLRNFVYEFAHMLSPQLTQAALQQAMQTPWMPHPSNLT